MNNIWNSTYASIFSLQFYNRDGKKISSGSGFKHGKYLITNNHVIQVSEAERIVLLTTQDDGCTTSSEITFTKPDFRSALKSGDPASAWDFAILEINRDDFALIPSLELEEQDYQVKIGTQIAILGYQFSQKNLSMHVGYISSQYEKNNVEYIQIDASVNRGNSGGPLINCSTGKVIGIVTRKETGLTQNFNEIADNIIEHISEMPKTEGTVFIEGVNQSAINNEVPKDIKSLMREIERSANVGIGYAYHIKKIKKEIEFLE